MNMREQPPTTQRKAAHLITLYHRKGEKSIANEDYLHIRISKDLKTQLQEQAQKENRTLSNYILNVLQKELEKSKK